MLKFEFVVNDIFNGEFSLGIYSCDGKDEIGEFYSLVIGFFFFEVWINKYRNE